MAIRYRVFQSTANVDKMLSCIADWPVLSCRCPGRPSNPALRETARFRGSRTGPGLCDGACVIARSLDCWTLPHCQPACQRPAASLEGQVHPAGSQTPFPLPSCASHQRALCRSGAPHRLPREIWRAPALPARHGVPQCLCCLLLLQPTSDTSPHPASVASAARFV